MSERREDVTHSAQGCPPTMRLRQWLDERGDLTSQDFEHIAGCQRCQDLLLTLTDDPSLSKMASSSQAMNSLGYQGEPELRRVQEQLAILARELNSSTDILHKTDRLQDPDAETVEDVASVLDIKEVVDGLPVNRFVVEELIARGGSGAVYKAFDRTLSREVAIKILSRNSMRDRQRFLREAKILADLEHPNVVKVFDVGALRVSGQSNQSDGVSSSRSQDNQSPLYLVLEYMVGGSARTLCDLASQEESHSATNEGSLIGFTVLAELVAQAARGLAYAHERGMIHRDVKPGNLLLNADRSQIKVADFGLARILNSEASLATRTGDIMGTPAFMSPEQIQNEGLITPLTDVYSLGASLYQMLTGTLPFQGTTASVLRQIVDARPVAPRLIRPSIPSDFETICLRAMEHEPKDRYRDMSEFAEDLLRFSTGQPIKAKPISTLSHVIRFMRRNKGIAGLIAICTTLLLTITVGSIAAAILLQSQQARLIASEANQRIAKESAVSALQSSINAADSLLLAVTTETEYLPKTTGSQKVTRKLLEKARDYYKDFLSQNQDNNALKLQLAKAHAGLAEVASRIGEREELESETFAALGLIAAIPDLDITPVQRCVMNADTRAVLANHFTESGEAKLAIPLFEESIADLIEVTGRGEQIDSKDEWQSSYATSLLGLANAYTWVGKRDEAFPLLDQAKENFLDLLSRHGEEASFLRNAAACDITYATTALDLQRPEEGREHLMDADRLLTRIQEDDAISLRVREMRIRLLTNLALAERRLGNNLEAKAHYQSAMEQTKRLIELEPSVTSHQWNLVVASLNSGGPDMELGLHDELVTRWQETIPVLDKLITQDPENQRYRQVQAMLQSNIAIILRDLGQFEAAIDPLKAATKILLAQATSLDFAPESYLPVALNHFELAQTFIKLGDVQSAESEIVECERIVDEILIKDQSFVPARAQRLDDWLLQFEIEKNKGAPDLARMQSISRLSIELVRALLEASPELLEFQEKLPIALLNETEVLILNQDFVTARSLLLEAQEHLESRKGDGDTSGGKEDLISSRCNRLREEINARLEK